MPVVVESDHIPLEEIHEKSLTQAPPRLQRMLLKLQPYDVNVKYKTGADMALADYFSRYPVGNQEPIILEKTIHSVQWSPAKLTQLKAETQNDEALALLTKIVHEGWPSKAMSHALH